MRLHEQARKGRDCARRLSTKEPKPLGPANASTVRDEKIVNLEQHDPLRWIENSPIFCPIKELD